MNNIEIKVTDLQWITNGVEADDLCAHGKVEINFGDILVEEVKGSHWTVSAMVLQLLRSCFNDHSAVDPEYFLVPCCGNAMYATEDPNRVNLVGCSSGFSWDIKHEGKNGGS